jgi:hypothetical protein
MPLPKMKIRLFIILVIIALLFSSGIIYLNQVILPTKIRSLITKGIEEATQKKVSFESLKFSVFKGLVLTKLNIYDDARTILSLEEASCTFLILPFFKKQVIIPGLRLKSPVLFVERRVDNSFNILEPFLKEVTPQVKNNRFSVLVRKINITQAHIDFQDNTQEPVFNKQIDALNLLVYLSLPAKVKFDLDCKIPDEVPAKISSSGEFNVLRNELAAQVIIKGLPIDQFRGYYLNLGSIRDIKGKIDALMNFNLRDQILNIGLDIQSNDLDVSREKILAKLNSATRADIRYNLKDKQLDYSGIMNILDLDISGLNFIERLDDVRGEVKFSNSGLSCDKILASVLGIPVEAKARIVLSDINNPQFNIDIISGLDLGSIRAILKEKFNSALFSDMQGKVQLSLTIKNGISLLGLPQISGFFDIVNGLARLEQANSAFEGINGRIQFTSNQLNWSGLNFKYLDTGYKTSGNLTDFFSPKVNFNLSSQDLNLDTAFSINAKRINLPKLSGDYLNSKFSLSGDIDIAEQRNINADINADLSINLEDLKVPLKKFKEQLERIKANGTLEVAGKLIGNLNDLRSCAIRAKLSSGLLSAYGLKAQEFTMDYNQENGLADITGAHISLYGGSIDAVARIGLASKSMPFLINSSIQGIKISELKNDTPAKDKDIAGIIQAQAKISGFSDKFSSLSGSGNIMITEGKLWQLNLFQGLGSVLFSKDFSNIIFTQGSCDFTVQDKYVFTDNLQLKSNIADLDGSVKIGFDNSIDGSLNVKVLDEAPLSGTLKDVTTAIIGEAGRFGAINISGTLKQPKFKFQTAVLDILKGFKDTFFKSQ